MVKFIVHPLLLFMILQIINYQHLEKYFGKTFKKIWKMG